jgi:hypothetical protein
MIGYLGHVFRMDADRTPSLLQRCWVVDGRHWQPSGKIKVLYDSESAVQKLLDEVGLSLLDHDAANKSEWHNINRPEARHPGFQPKLPPNGPLRLLSPNLNLKGLSGLHHPHHEQLPVAPR